MCLTYNYTHKETILTSVRIQTITCISINNLHHLHISLTAPVEKVCLINNYTQRKNIYTWCTFSHAFETQPLRDRQHHTTLTATTPTVRNSASILLPYIHYSTFKKCTLNIHLSGFMINTQLLPGWIHTWYPRCTSVGLWLCDWHPP